MTTLEGTLGSIISSSLTLLLKNYKSYLSSISPPSSSHYKTVEEIYNEGKSIETVLEKESDSAFIISQTCFNKISSYLEKLETSLLEEYSQIEELKRVRTRNEGIFSIYKKFNTQNTQGTNPRSSEYIPKSSIEHLPTEILLEILEKLDIDSLISTLQSSPTFFNLYNDYSEQITKSLLKTSLHDPNITNYLPSINSINPQLSKYKLPEDYTGPKKSIVNLYYLTELTELDTGLERLLKLLEDIQKSVILSGEYWSEFSKWGKSCIYKGMIETYQSTTEDCFESSQATLPEIEDLSIDTITSLYRYNHLEDIIDISNTETSNLVIRKYYTLMTFKDLVHHLTDELGIQHTDILRLTGTPYGMESFTSHVLKYFHPLDIYFLGIDNDDTVSITSKNRRTRVLRYLSICRFIKLFYEFFYDEFRDDTDLEGLNSNDMRDEGLSYLSM